MRVLRDDVLARAKTNRDSGNGYELWPAAHEPHLDASLFRVVDGVMLESVEVEVGIELAVQPREQIQIERSGDAPAVVVRRTQDGAVVTQIDAEQ